VPGTRILYELSLNSLSKKVLFMETKSFLPEPEPLSVADIISLTDATPHKPQPPLDLRISRIKPLDTAGDGDITFLDNPKYLPLASETKASICFSAKRYGEQILHAKVVLITPQPYHAFAKIAAALYPDALHPQPIVDTNQSSQAHISPQASLEDGVSVEAFAVIGAGAQIGSNTHIGPGAVIGPNVAIGRNSHIGANVTVSHALIGDHVIIHPGTTIGQDGFGLAMSARGHQKVVQVGRVLIQNHVEIGANCCIDRGSNTDTIIGEGTKIDNQVQIAHNVCIGRHCVFAAQVGIAGSAKLGDFVTIGGQTGVNGHVTIGDGAQIAACSAVKDSVPPGARWGGTPAKPARQAAREHSLLARMAKRQN